MARSTHAPRESARTFHPKGGGTEGLPSQVARKPRLPPPPAGAREAACKRHWLLFCKIQSALSGSRPSPAWVFQGKLRPPCRAGHQVQAALPGTATGGQKPSAVGRARHGHHAGHAGCRKPDRRHTHFRFHTLRDARTPWGGKAGRGTLPVSTRPMCTCSRLHVQLLTQSLPEVLKQRS